MTQVNQNEGSKSQGTAKSPINWELMEQRSLDAESLKMVLPIFIENNGQYVSDLQQAWDSKDQQAVVSISHTIKGSAANIGAEALSHAALLLNHGCRDGSLDEAAQQDLIKQIAQLHDELQEYISTLGE